MWIAVALSVCLVVGRSLAYPFPYPHARDQLMDRQASQLQQRPPFNQELMDRQASQLQRRPFNQELMERQASQLQQRPPFNQELMDRQASQLQEHPTFIQEQQSSGKWQE